MTKGFLGEDGVVKNLEVASLEWFEDKSGNKTMEEVEGTKNQYKADLVLLAMGFIHPTHEGLLDNLGVDYDNRGNVKADSVNYETSIPKVFAAGDMRRGQSLVVWAIREGRQCAASIDNFLKKPETL